jgi:hypothetical protein
MYHAPKISATRLALRKTAMAASAVRRAFPAWIDSAQGLAFPALAPVNGPVTARVRDSLVLRAVASDKPRRSRHPFVDVPGGR